MGGEIEAEEEEADDDDDDDEEPKKKMVFLRIYRGEEEEEGRHFGLVGFLFFSLFFLPFCFSSNPFVLIYFLFFFYFGVKSKINLI